jgi:hypothetical protein
MNWAARFAPDGSKFPAFDNPFAEYDYRRFQFMMPALG